MNDPRSGDFLLELFNKNEGDISRQVSIHDVGISIGLEKAEAQALAEDLIMEEFVELKTLAGGIGITSRGIEVLQKSGMVRTSFAASSKKLSNGPIIDEEDRNIIEEALQQIREALSCKEGDFHLLEQVVIDIKTIEVQLLSPQAKTGVVREVIASLRGVMGRLHLSEMEKMLKKLHE